MLAFGSPLLSSRTISGTPGTPISIRFRQPFEAGETGVDVSDAESWDLRSVGAPTGAARRPLPFFV